MFKLAGNKNKLPELNKDVSSCFKDYTKEGYILHTLINSDNLNIDTSQHTTIAIDIWASIEKYKLVHLRGSLRLFLYEGMLKC